MINMRLGGASNRSLGNIMKKMGEDCRALHHNGIGGLWALAWKNLSKLPQFYKRNRLAPQSYPRVLSLAQALSP